MKKFVVTSFFFFLFIGSLFYSISYIFFQYPLILDKIGYSKNWFETYKIASKSYQSISSDTLFIGDSVSGQLFPPNQSKNFITTNAGTLMTGQYIIAANTIDANPNLKCIVLIGLPISIGARFEGLLTFNGFVKPFFEERNLKHFNPYLLEKLYKKPLARYFDIRPLKFMPFSDINYYNGLPNPVDSYEFSDVAIQYLKKLNQLCIKKNIDLKILSGPMAKTYLTKTNNWQYLRKQLEKENLTVLFTNYFESIEYLEKNKFSDGTHLKPEYISTIRSHVYEQLN